MSASAFAKDTPNKISTSIDVSGKNTLIKREDNGFRVAIADEPIDVKVDGKKMFCVRVDDAGKYAQMMFGFTPDETFDSEKQANFGYKDFGGCGIYLFEGQLFYPVSKVHNIIDGKISQNAKEIISILTISNNGKKKEIRFLCDGKETTTSDVSEGLKGDFLFPAICLGEMNQQVTAIQIDQIKTRTPEIENLIKEHQEQQQQQQQQQKRNSFLRFVSISDFFLQKYPLLQQHEELGRIFLQQREILFRGLMATL
jgi:hypothetical protein